MEEEYPALSDSHRSEEEEVDISGHYSEKDLEELDLNHSSSQVAENCSHDNQSESEQSLAKGDSERLSSRSKGISLVPLEMKKASPKQKVIQKDHKCNPQIDKAKDEEDNETPPHHLSKHQHKHRDHQDKDKGQENLLPSPSSSAEQESQILKKRQPASRLPDIVGRLMGNMDQFSSERVPLQSQKTQFRTAIKTPFDRKAFNREQEQEQNQEKEKEEKVPKGQKQHQQDKKLRRQKEPSRQKSQVKRRKSSSKGKPKAEKKPKIKKEKRSERIKHRVPRSQKSVSRKSQYLAEKVPQVIQKTVQVKIQDSFAGKGFAAPKLGRLGEKEGCSMVKGRESSSSPDSADGLSSSSSSSRREKVYSRKIKKHKRFHIRLTMQDRMQIYKRKYVQLQIKFDKLKFRCRKCPRGHYMRYCLHDEDSLHRISCNYCNRMLVEVCLVYWECRKCRLVTCGQCEGYDKEKCPFGHPLKQSDHFEGERTCDVCLNKKFVDGLSCSCDFDICGRCLGYHREIVEDGNKVICID